MLENRSSVSWDVLRREDLKSVPACAPIDAGREVSHAGNGWVGQELPLARIVTPGQRELRDRLVETIRAALPFVYQAERATADAERAYKLIAQILVDLRHQFVTSDGHSPDLRGRSRGYRSIVRYAYAEAGTATDGPVEKRLSAGVAYWVRKILIDQYGERRLRELGILPHSATSVLQKLLVERRIDNPRECMATVAGVLNMLASDTSFTPTEEVVRSAARAIAVMQARIHRIANTASV